MAEQLRLTSSIARFHGGRLDPAGEKGQRYRANLPFGSVSRHVPVADGGSDRAGAAAALHRGAAHQGHVVPAPHGPLPQLTRRADGLLGGHVHHLPGVVPCKRASLKGAVTGAFVHCTPTSLHS